MKEELTIVLRARDAATRVFKTVGRSIKSFASGGVQLIGKLRNSLLSLRSLLLAGALSSGVGLFADFETGIASTLTLLDEGKGSFSEFAEGVKDVAALSGQSFDALNTALFDTVSAGIDAGDAVGFLTTASKLAVGGVTDVASATKGLVSVLNAYNLDASYAAEVSDSLFQTQRKGLTTINLLGNNIGKVAPQAALVGLSIDEMGAALAALTSKGISTEESITSLNAVFQGLIKPLPDAIALADKLGIELSTASTKGGKFGQFLVDVAEKTKLNEKEISTLFGSIQSFKGIATLAANGGKAFNDTLAAMADKAGATDRAFKTVSETLKFQFTGAFREIQIGILTIVQELGPELRSLAGSIGEFGVALQDNAAEIATWGRLVIRLARITFDFLVQQIKRYGEDSSKIWEDLGSLAGATFRIWIRAAGTSLNLFAKTVLFTVQGLIDEIANSFKGFSIADLITDGDAFAERAGLLKAAKDARAARIAIEAEVAGLEKSIADVAARQETNPLSFIGDVSGERAQLAQRKREVEELIDFERKAFAAAGRQRIEDFGEAFKARFAGFGTDATAEISSAFSDVGSIVDKLFGSVGAGNISARAKEAFAQFQIELAKASDANPGTDRKERVAKLLGVTPGAAGTVGEELARRLKEGAAAELARGATLIDAGLTEDIKARTRDLNDAVALLRIADETERQIAEINQFYDRDVASFRAALDAKKIAQADFEAFSVASEEARQREIDAIRERGVTGFKSGLNESQQVAQAVGDQIGSSFASFFSDFRGLADDAGKAFAQFAENLLQDLARIFLNKAFQLLIGKAGAEGTAGTGLLGALGFANGGVVPGGFQAFAGGSPNVSRPTLGLVGEGRFNEAVVPLPDGRSIPVVMSGGGGGSVNITFNVQSLDGDNAARVILANAPAIEAVISKAMTKKPEFRSGIRGKGPENR